MTAFELKRVFLFQSVHQLAGMMLPVIQGTQLLLASFFLMIATVFPFQAGVSSKDITGKFYILIVKKSRRKLVKIIRSVELATKKERESFYVIYEQNYHRLEKLLFFCFPFITYFSVLQRIEV